MLRLSKIRKFLVPFLVVASCVLVLVGFWFLSQLGPTEVSYDEALLEANFEPSESVAQLAKRSEQLEAEFEEIVRLREPDAASIALVAESLELQEKYVKALPGYNVSSRERLERLRKKYQDLEAAELLTQSKEFEAIAASLSKSKDYAEIELNYRVAFDLQKTINESYPLSDAYNPSRAAFLQRQLTYTSAEPMRAKSERLEEEADGLISLGQWDAAEEKLIAAIDVQDSINVQFRMASQASFPRVENMKLKLLKVKSGDKYLEIEKMQRLADQAQADNEMLKAASLYDEARRLQMGLNTDFPNSPYASSQNLIDLQRKSQTAQSYSLGIEIEEGDERLRGLLAAQRVMEAAEVIVSLQRGLRQMEEAFPMSSLNNEELQVKIRFLSLLQTDIGFIQNRMNSSVQSIDGVDGWSILQTEVSQALYTLLMGTNPSRNVGDQKPVDSVSWVEAKRFCNRLSWLMGKAVRLPTEYEFRQSLGKLRYLVLEDYVWSATDGQLEPQAVGTKQPFASGVYDLLGNVGEWLESEDSTSLEDAKHMGGSIQDSLEEIFTVPSGRLSRTSRNRTIGFRVVVSNNSSE
jgi:hypothetical protein